MTQWVEGPDPVADPELVERLKSAVLELEHHASQDGWDQPGRLFALISTQRFVELEGAAVAEMGLDPADQGFTALEQEIVAGEDLEEMLLSVSWPEVIEGCAVVVERLVLPPDAEEELPGDPAAAAEFAASHPKRQDVRIVAAVLRQGATYAALRLRAPEPAGADSGLAPEDDDLAVVHGPDVVPTLLGLLLETFAEDAGGTAGPGQQRDGAQSP